MNARQLAVLGGTSLLRGGSYVLIVCALDALGPLALALAQSLVAALVLVALLLVRGREGVLATRPLRARGTLPLLAVLQNVAPIVLVAVAVGHIDTGLVAILLATTPLLSAALARAGGVAERLTRRQAAGLAVGLAGVAATTGGGSIDGAAEALAALAVLAAAGCYAAAGLLVRRSGVPPIEGACWAFAASVPMLAPLALLEGGARLPDAGELAAIVALGAACTGRATAMYFWLIAQAGPARALLVTYLAPPVALGLGAALLDERLTLISVLGLPLVLAGVGIASRA